jgi:hypothetical protein
MIEPVYVPYEHYKAAKTGCGLDSRIYGIQESYISTHDVLETLVAVNSNASYNRDTIGVMQR